MKEQVFSVTVNNDLGLHARAAAVLVKAVSGYSSQVAIKYNNVEVNGKSLIDIIGLAAGKGAVLEVKVSGEDAVKCSQELQNTVNNNFGE
ncbi:MAG: HPr family phosphocarrier protein [Mucispirillum sp.]|nr:HPr family phosphocarrier protein [Mucispirillum sp.]